MSKQEITPSELLTDLRTRLRQLNVNYNAHGQIEQILNHYESVIHQENKKDSETNTKSKSNQEKK